MATITTSFNETNVNIQNNTSDLTITCYFSPDNQQTYNMEGMALYCACNGVTQSATVYLPLGGSVTQSFTFTNIPHDNDGSKTVAWQWSCDTDTSVLGYIQRSGNQTLQIIPRYTSITKFIASQIDETSLKISWATSDQIDYLWYRYKKTTDAQYSNWIGTSINNKTSGTFNQTSLSANTNYAFQLKVRRTDSQLETTSTSDAEQTTYDYPYIASVAVNPLTIGNQQTLTLYNPLNRSVTVKMYKDNTSGTQLYSNSTSGTNLSFTPNATTLYNSIPNSQSGNCVYSVIYGSTSTKTTSVHTYRIRGDEYPTFEATNWTYTADKTTLTNNNQVVIDKYSTITASIGTPASSSYGASISKYVITWGSVSSTTTSTSGSVTGGSGNTLIVIAYDSRGLPKSTSKQFDEYITYTDLKINEINTDRDNGIEAGVKLEFSGRMWNGKFGTSGANNTLSSAKYYVSTNGTTWSSAYPSDNSMLNAITQSSGYFSLSNFTIHANGSSGGFTIGQQYYVKVVVYDGSNQLSNSQIVSIISDGKVARTVYQDSNGEYHEGINGLPDDNYTQKINGKLNASGGVFSNGTELKNVTYGTTAGTACEGNDSRLSDSRTPTSHASSATTYGVGTTSNYGHCKLADNLTTSSYADGVALAANQGKSLKDLIDTLTPVTLYDDATGKQSGSYITISDISNYKKLQITFTIYIAATNNQGGTSNIIWLDLTRNLSNTCRCGITIPYLADYITGSSMGTDFRAVFEADLSNGRLYPFFAYGSSKQTNAYYVMTKVLGYKY